LANSVTAQARSNATANEAWHLTAWAELELGQAHEARASLQRVVPSYSVDAFCLAAVEAALGRVSRAVALLEGARADAPLGVEATKLLVDSYARLGLFARACTVTKEALGVLDPTDTRRVIEAAYLQNANGPATELAAALALLTGSAEDASLHAQGLARLRDRDPPPRDSSGLRDSVV
jgi:tetratricopeptide (TPR) repeat protein